ncbi:MAG TPA: SDR family oxidoreductase [Oligoflexus sp.]|uniref:SDR family oxidoreductase n=1 Tax=Oligoflexus sp. TaxID=1971216 RepID=UPI002D6A1785|nr:SDR family oxidoreductase [Oligoflexus sp.]HYX35305.1 SDR family oxidoreductase [Oligoflexus sp.]
MKRSIQDSVVVITGASSGIGRAAALDFAKQGARLVLAARSEDQLQEVAEACERLGATALVVPTDVSQHEAVKQLAERAITTFGGIDVWVNDAAVSLFARLEDAPWEDYRQVIETNLFGYIHGTRVVVPHFRERGRGTLINISSMVGKTGAPYISAYAISKAAIIGLSDSLRQELLDLPDIHVCTVLPASIDTPIFQHAANYTGKAVKPMNPIYDVEAVASEIVKLALHPRREVYVGGAGRRIGLLSRIAPGLAQRMMAKQVNKDHFASRPAEPSDGNIHEPMSEISGTSGHWRQKQEGSSSRTALIVGLATVGVGLAALIIYRKTTFPILTRRLGNHGFKALANTALVGLSKTMQKSNKQLRKKINRDIKKPILRLVS